MKQFSLLLICAAAFCTQIDAKIMVGVRTGTYELKGSITDSDVVEYKGTVTIEPYGKNYKLFWKIGEKQTQHGIGIVSTIVSRENGIAIGNNILSVVYQDDESKDFGVVSFVVGNDGTLDGKWTSFNGGQFSQNEHLTWISDLKAEEPRIAEDPIGWNRDWKHPRIEQ